MQNQIRRMITCRVCEFRAPLAPDGVARCAKCGYHYVDVSRVPFANILADEMKKVGNPDHP